MKYTAITIRGNILSYERLEKIQQAETVFQSVQDFGFDKSTNLRDKIGSAWSESKMLWNIYQKKLGILPERETGTSETRKLWMIPFLMELGYDPETSKATEIDGKSFAISHHDDKRDGFPMLIMGHEDNLDKKPEGNRLRMSPHALMQEYLNKSEHLYGIVTNGRTIRLLRDSYRLAKLSFIEFDLERIYEEELYFEFALLYRLLHGTRMPKSLDQAEKAPIEIYHQDSLDSGARIRDQLRYKVKEAMEVLANGLIQDHSNADFRETIEDHKIDAQSFYKLLLRVMYRIIFLSTIEERDLVFPRKSTKDEYFRDYLRKKNIYLKYYGIERLRKLAVSKVYINPTKHDLWKSLTTTFSLFEPIGEGEKMGILPLGGDLFASSGLTVDGFNIRELGCSNRFLINIIENLTTFQDTTGSKVRVNYRDLDVEELGSIYEALLELHPYFNTESEKPIFGFSEGSQRKLTGSYYTRHDLVAQLIKTALYPVLDDRLEKAKTREEKEKVLLSIKVCDPAAGSGHFLIAAAKALGFELAKIRSDEENPGEKWVLDATRDVISQCIHGVDKNPDAVELCRISLWLTGHSSGKPLTFLDHKIKCGDSLVGVDNLDRLKKGIPDGAFKPVTGDNKAIASSLKKRNADFLKKRQYSLFLDGKMNDHQHRFAEEYQKLNEIKVESTKDYQKAKAVYTKTHVDPLWQKDHTACNLFTWAFFQPYEDEQSEKDAVTSELLAQYLLSAGSLNAKVEGLANARSQEFRYFHWSLEFPDVFEKGGFDLILGNPPWEKIKLIDSEFFSTRDLEIATARTAGIRKKLIKKLEEDRPNLFQDYQNAIHNSERNIKFIKQSERFELATKGDLNTYPLFIEFASSNYNKLVGRTSMIVPTGIATDDSTSRLFRMLVDSKSLLTFFDFVNSRGFFPDVDSNQRFALVSLGNNVNRKMMFAFFLKGVEELAADYKVFEIKISDFKKFNPNTNTCPSFSTKYDAEIAKKIYSLNPIIKNESIEHNPWEVDYLRMFDLTNDSNLFISDKTPKSKPLYESKMFHIMNHRYAHSAEPKGGMQRRGSSQILSEDELINPNLVASARNHVETSILSEKISKEQKWFIAFRDTTGVVANIRTAIFALLPSSAVANSAPIIVPRNDISTVKKLLLFGNFCSLSFDFFARQKVGGLHMNFFIVNQLPVVHPLIYQSSTVHSIIPIITELNYTSWDIKAFADDLWKEADDELKLAIKDQWEENKKITGGHEWKIPDWADAYPEIEWEKDKGCPLPPFKWDEDRRALLRAEVDAYFALLYGLERDELRYILDPQDVYGEDFPGETFRVLKNKEIKKYGEYRTRRLVLEAYDRLRPDWDMEAHLIKLKEVWEKYQEDLSNKDKKSEKPSKQKGNPKKVEEPKEQYGMFGSEPVAVEEKVTLGSRVKVHNHTQGKDFAFHIVKDSKHAQIELEYQPIPITSQLALAMINGKVGSKFKDGGNEYKILMIE